MFPFWEKVVAPILEAAEARRIVEIGALRGENTKQMLDRLGPDVELHVVDPVPDFDPDDHARRFGGQYVFHRALSLDVLGTLPPMDAALVDGDHNWYTVVNELRLLRDVTRAAGRPLPVLVLHDVGWPYGRRDLYYDPDTVPAEHRQPWRRAGMRPGRSELLANGGLNPTMCNADHEGGPRNGVMTAVDDFVAEHDVALRVVVLPVYFGLAVVVEEQRLHDQPALRAVIDHLESATGKDDVIDLAEATRIEAMLFQHRIFFEKEAELERRADLYLDSVKRALVNQHYLENEVRLARLARCVENGNPLVVPNLRDPARNDNPDLVRLRIQRETGLPPDDGPLPSGYVLAPWGRPALDALHGVLDDVRHDHVRGDLVACGADRGGSAVLLRAYLEAHSLAAPTVWVADTFRAAADGSAQATIEDGLADLRTDLNQVREAFEAFGLFDDRTRFLQGELVATLPDAPFEQVAVLHLGRDLSPADVTLALDQLLPRIGPGGAVVVEHGHDPEVRAAVDDVRTRLGVEAPIGPAGPTGLVWRVEVAATHTPAAVERPAGAARTPLAVAPAGEPCDLSVVLVVYDMRREAARTLHALSRSYQRDVGDLDYEVIVVENGSSPEGRLDAEMVSSFGPEFRYLDLGDDATPSPAPAMNRGIAESRGRNVALMVDGAHLLTPGVLHQGMTGLRAYEPAVVLTQPWHVGPGQQNDTMRSGYDQRAEDELFDAIEWPSDGYRLFEIGHFHGDRDWLDGLWESNCLFVPRKVLEQVGGFEEGFHVAGGGYTNLEVYERLAATPGVEVVTILGEGSFHQIHGGTTTNSADPTERGGRVSSYSDRFGELRGRAFTGPEKPVQLVGSFRSDESKRTRARRMTAKAFAVDPTLEGESGPLSRPVPVPDELRDSFINAYWRSHAWRHTGWMGHQVPVPPTDLLTYQDLVHEIRPDWIIETGTRGGGRALFLASVCDLLDHGRIVSIDSSETERPPHPRVTYIAGTAHDDDVVSQVRDLVGREPNGLVILGTRGARRRMHREFRAYSPMVPVGSYVVMEQTVLNGYPVDATFGPGPFEAIRRILNHQGRFVADTRREEQALSFNLGGYLRRVK